MKRIRKFKSTTNIITRMTTSELAINKRGYHSFLSHAHSDKKIVDQIYHWLYNVVEIPIWYDSSNLPGSSLVATELSEAINNCRSMIIILSKTSIEKNWVEIEYNAAFEQKSKFKTFRIIPVRIDDCVPPGFLKSFKYIDISRGSLDLDSAHQILDSIYYNDAIINFKTDDLYISRSWRENDSRSADYLCKLLDRKGFRLIGDYPDQQGFEGKKNQDRIKSIMSSCKAFVAIVPDRGNVPPQNT